jgi:hypothetical protein
MSRPKPAQNAEPSIEIMSGKIGRPPHEPTKETRFQVRVAAAIGLPHKNIGRLIGIAECTLNAHYREELDIGLDRMITDVAKNMYKIAATGTGQAAVSAGKYILSVKAGWREGASLDVNFGGGVSGLLRAMGIEAEPQPIPEDENGDQSED